ncbi:MAG TPA: hypothetical protein VGC87_05825 [Pyrinomonadaceae bacterium]|jgi:hypothetical protein
MHVMRLIGGAVLVLACAWTGAAQSGQCALKPAQLPAVRGLRIGMTAAEFKSLYPRLVVGPADEFGQTRAQFQGAQLALAEPAAFKGVDDLYVKMIDDRVVEFGLTYDQLPWRDLDQFVATTSALLGLPGEWKGGENWRTLDCGRVQLRAARSSWSPESMSPALSFKALDAEEVVAARVAKKRERQIESFKP